MFATVGTAHGHRTPVDHRAEVDRRRVVIAAAPVTPERDAGRDRRHLVPVLAGWALAGWGWVRAIDNASQQQVLLPVLVVVASLIVCVALTAAWVAHNRRIYRTKGPRTGLPTARVEYATDWVGRPVTTEWSLVQSAPELVVVSGEGWKAVWPARIPGAAREADTRPWDN